MQVFKSKFLNGQLGFYTNDKLTVKIGFLDTLLVHVNICVKLASFNFQLT